MNPLVSIVTPSFNCGAFIEETLRSVEQQDYPRIEHIVLDSGSTDETLAILARHPSVRLVTPAPQGLSAKVNHGFSIARGEIVAWINADDFYLPGAISKAVDALKRNPGVALVYCNFLQVDEHSVEIDRELTKQASWQEMLARDYIPVESAFIRREALERVGPLDTRYPLVQDWDLFLRISKQFPILYVDDHWSAFRVREGQRSDLYKYDFWIQARQMTKEHGADFFPLFRDYWGTKLGRASRMARNGQFRLLKSKLAKYILSFGRRQVTRNRSDY
ncbi:glycosyltransferase family 2 protein [Caenimonas soli]|uniref:glycosyltransferase family 2 protein n=1 Tax=Caenimonas soli TaxID=2735555 RepID=UPI0015548D6E|nr:glycosyltransferase family 2 protein [Caenimonas soli]NPC57468.1 glycosyltransferase [Caenimonas soli]